MGKLILVLLAVVLVVFVVRSGDDELTKASQSSYNQNYTKAHTSHGLSNADIAWHAQNTYGWDCSEVVDRGSDQGGYFHITCKNGTRLRVYPRHSAHPKITNLRGTYN